MGYKAVQQLHTEATIAHWRIKHFSFTVQKLRNLFLKIYDKKNLWILRDNFHQKIAPEDKEIHILQRVI